MKHVKKTLALLLCVVMLLGIAVPAAAASGTSASAQAQNLLRATKSVAFGNTYVYPYGTTFDTTVLKGGSANLCFKRDQTTPGGNSDKLYILIVRGTSEDYWDESDIIEERTYSMKEFNNSANALAITWKADSRYSTGAYCLYCLVMDSHEEIYEQDYYVVDLYVASGNSSATEVFPYSVYDGYFYSGMPDTLSIDNTICLMPSLWPTTTTTPHSYNLYVSDSSLVDVRYDSGYYYLTAKAFGYVDIILTCGSLICEQDNVIVGFPNSVELTPGKTELCVGNTDTIRVKTYPDLPAKPRWESSNTAVATVVNGIVTGRGPGKATITAYLGQQSFSVDYTVSYHSLPADAPSYERTATMPRCTIGHCSRCGQDDAMNIFEPAIFSDTPYNAWYAEYVDYVCENAIMNGVGAGMFSPNADMSRAMVATSLYRMEGEPAVSGGAGFSDVPYGQWYSDAVSWAAENGIVTGYPDGTFQPNTPITREQFATILYRYTLMKKVEMKEGADLTAFPDSASVYGYAVDAMKWAIAEGLITGVVSDGVTRLAPQNNTSRAQFATIVTRYQNTEWKLLPVEEELEERSEAAEED